MKPPTNPTALKFQSELAARGLPAKVVEFSATTRTAADAAAAIGCQVGQIVKSLIFKTQDTQQAILVLTSGANRVDESRLHQLAGEPLAKADADFVRAWTGYAIGGVPPFGHAQPMRTFIDEDLLAYATIWAAAGTPNAVFELRPAELVAACGGNLVKVS
jgi:prolyl-tRNA editing enzyme YbaK/EbsC (Cys-tRNA(Pro) deacylase)